MKNFKLSPSDFRWLLDRCPRCWWQKIHSLVPPKDALPAIFGTIDRGMKQGMTVEALRERGIPAKADFEVKYLLSSPITFEEHDVQFVLSGYLDKAFELEDGTFTITEFKTARADAKKLIGFERQLHGYQYCLENPAKGTAIEVTDLSIFTFEPFESDAFVLDGNRAKFEGSLTHFPIEVNRVKFHKYLEGLAALAGQLDMPEPGEGCSQCAYVADVVRYEKQLAAVVAKQAEKVAS